MGTELLTLFIISSKKQYRILTKSNINFPSFSLFMLNRWHVLRLRAVDGSVSTISKYPVA